jgi:hypothetical protein
MQCANLGDTGRLPRSPESADIGESADVGDAIKGRDGLPAQRENGRRYCITHRRQGKEETGIGYLAHALGCAFNMVRDPGGAVSGILGLLGVFLAALTFWSSHRLSQRASTPEQHQLTGTRYAQKVWQRKQTWRISSANPRAARSLLALPVLAIVMHNLAAGPLDCFPLQIDLRSQKFASPLPPFVSA